MQFLCLQMSPHFCKNYFYYYFYYSLVFCIFYRLNFLLFLTVPYFAPCSFRCSSVFISNFTEGVAACRRPCALARRPSTPLSTQLSPSAAALIASGAQSVVLAWRQELAEATGTSGTSAAVSWCLRLVLRLKVTLRVLGLQVETWNIPEDALTRILKGITHRASGRAAAGSIPAVLTGPTALRRWCWCWGRRRRRRPSDKRDLR